MLKKIKKSDYWLLLFTIIICLLGLIMVYSASWPDGIKDGNDGGLYFKNQLRAFILGIIAMLFMRKIDYRIFKSKITEITFGIALVLNIIVRFISEPVNGAYRWIELPLGLSFMPSDILKLSSILLFAKILSSKKYKMNEFRRGFFPFIILLGLLMAILLYFQSDLGTAASLGISLFFMYVISGVRIIYPFIIGILGIVSGGYMTMSKGYRRERFTTFLNPFKDKLGEGWQVVQSLYAIGSGGVLGVGLGQSKQKYYYLPFPYSDFIFSIFAEEFGLIGSLILIGLYLAFAIRGLRIAILIKDRFGKLLAYGLTVIVFIQAMIHIAVATSSIPATGITMPLFSYGGTSLVINLIGIGILLNISSHIKINTKGE
ncbi:MAG: putative peptidoglycan glycosyltransferase FtsW [Andreesenia angusta]|nr:putative peptidoglycan glycosyltransferase FtsW [Andreesenia angusta]